jgi:hypothetical protein
VGAVAYGGVDETAPYKNDEKSMEDLEGIEPSANITNGSMGGDARGVIRTNLHHLNMMCSIGLHYIKLES